MYVVNIVILIIAIYLVFLSTFFFIYAQADSYLSSTPSSLAELTEDHSLSQKATGHADYMEDANSFNLT